MHRNLQNSFSCFATAPGADKPTSKRQEEWLRRYLVSFILAQMNCHEEKCDTNGGKIVIQWNVFSPV